MKYGARGQGDRKDMSFLRRKENEKKSMEMTNKKIHKTRVCKCCEGTHKKVKQDEQNNENRRKQTDQTNRVWINIPRVGKRRE